MIYDTLLDTPLDLRKWSRNDFLLVLDRSSYPKTLLEPSRTLEKGIGKGSSQWTID